MWFFDTYFKNISFANPHWLWLLPLVVFFIVFRPGKQVTKQGFFPLFFVAEQFNSINKKNRFFKAGFLWCSCVFFLILSLAKPQLTRQQRQHPKAVTDIIFVVDVSGSMMTKDVEYKKRLTSRLDAARAVITDFLQQAKQMRVGMIGFAGGPFHISPLTTDLKNLPKIMKFYLEPQDAIKQGTAIGTAVVAAMHYLLDVKTKSRIIVLLTDGENNAGKISPQEAAKKAVELGIKISTINLNRNISYASTVNPSAAKLLAEETGGTYYSLNTSYNIADIFREIKQQIATKVIATTPSYYQLHPWLTLASIVCFIIALLRLRS